MYRVLRVILFLRREKQNKMDSGSLGQIIALIILVIFSAYFSATETAFTSMNRIRLKNMAQEGNKRAGLVMKLAENYDKILSTILIGNNIVNISATAVATALFIGLLDDVGRGTTLATVITTVAVLIFGEITPKSIAKDRPESFAMFSAPILNLLTILLYPLNLIFQGWKKLVSLVVKPEEEKGEFEAELLTMVEEAENDGDMEAGEVELIRNAIEFNDIEVADILQPRVKVEAVEIGDSWDEVEKLFRESGYSRLPVYRETIDNMIGVVNQKDFFMANHKNLKKITKPVEFVVPAMKISELMVKLQKSKSHMAAVVDEYGGVAGIVTLEDIIEELVGDIWDEHDEIIEEFKPISENEFKVRCSASLDDLYERFDLKGEPESPTVGGWVIEELKELPRVGDTFDYENLTVTVTECDNKHALAVVVKVNETLKEEEN